MNAETPEYYIIKSSGEQELFNEEKLRNSLRRSGADERLVERVMKAMEGQWHEGMTTKTIYKKAFKLLKRWHQPTAARYTLKQAMFDMGPSGGPFEDFVAEILKSRGYQVERRQIVPGICIRHEVDVIAENGDKLLWIECKYHPLAGSVSNVKIPLYIHSRFRDLDQYRNTHDGNAGEKNALCWIVTNTRFSEDAEAYGRCAGLYLVGWNYPNGNSLRNMIDAAGLHPVTCLTTLTRHEKNRLLENGIVLSRKLSEPGAWAEILGLSGERRMKVMEEARILCTTP